MPKKSLHINKGYKQQTKNSCWAACSRFAWNYYESHLGHPFNSDKDLAHVVGLHLDSEASIEEVLKKLHLWTANDSEHIPSFDDIVSAINNNEMICACVNPIRHGYLNRKPTVGGHYVVIIGYDTDNYMIQVMNPIDGSINWILFNQVNYEWPGGTFAFWCGTSYAKKYPK